MKKRFFYTTTERSVSNGTKVNMNVYEVKKDWPVFVGSTTFNRMSMYSYEDEAFEVVKKNGAIPNAWIKRMKEKHMRFYNWKMEEEFNLKIAAL